jgi:YD repeat-containing protein
MLSRTVSAVLFAAAALPASAGASTPALPSVAISIGMSPASPRAGSDVRLTGGAGAASYAWDLDGDGQFDDADGIGVTARFAAGERTVRAQAVTAAGVVTDSRTFTVHDWNVAPGGTVGVTPYTARAGSPVAVKASGSDPDGLGVQTALDLDGDGSFETAGASGTATFATPGVRVIRARFTDDAGATAVATTTLDVHAGNLAPTARIESPPLSVATAADEPTAYTVNALDPDGEIVRYEYDADGDGTYETDRGGDARIPRSVLAAPVIAVRVTDDGGATAIERSTIEGRLLGIPRVAQVGVPTTLSVPDSFTDVAWDADGDGDFDDGTGKRISFTYPSAGTYQVRVSAKHFGRAGVFFDAISVRDAAGIAVPAARWTNVPPARATVLTRLGYDVSGPAGADPSFDLDGDGGFGDAPPSGGGVAWAFGGPAIVSLKATDSGRRIAVTSTQVPFVAADLGPDAAIRTFDVPAPLKAVYRRTELFASAGDADGEQVCCPQAAWDADNDGEYDDGPYLSQSGEDGPLPASFGVRVTDSSGVSTTLRRTVTPISSPPAKPDTTPWLRVAALRPHLATLLRRGWTVTVSCTKPGCRTGLVAKLDTKTARKLKLRSRVFARRTLSGSRRLTLKLSAKARRALRHVRTVKLTLSATATAPGGARATVNKTATIRR